MKSILQSWVMELGLRHQGTLLTAIRGCDTAPKDDPSKLLARCFRDAILNAHCGDSAKARTFIERVTIPDLRRRMDDFRRNCDHYPQHYIAHLIHSAEIVGYKHPDPDVRGMWHSFYIRMVHALHMNPETEDQLDKRLNADEETFGRQDCA